MVNLSDASCPRCAGPVVVICFVEGSSQMKMASCPSCHTRSWWRDGVAVELGEVLATMSTGAPRSTPLDLSTTRDRRAPST